MTSIKVQIQEHEFIKKKKHDELFDQKTGEFKF